MSKIKNYIHKTTRAKLCALSLAVLLALLTAIFGATLISADESYGDTVYEKNNALLQEKYADLLNLKASNAGSAEGRNVNNYIDIYAKKINSIDKAILYHASAAEVIELYWTQGHISGNVAWIYYGNIDEFEGAPKNAIDSVHTDIQEKIENTTNAQTLTELAGLSYSNNGLYARMYKAVYEQKLLALLRDGDSDAVKAIINGENGAIVSITKCTDSTSSAQYDAIYSKAAGDVAVQRNRDTASRELTDIFAILFPNADPAENTVVRNALEKINSSSVTQTAAMNAEVKGAVSSLLTEISSDGGAFVEKYFSLLKSDIAEAVSLADGRSEIADVSALFVSYGFDFASASAKDTIAADIASRDYKNDPEMAALLAEYNSDGGIIDKCDSVAAISFETERAKLRADLYGKYLETVATIDKWVGDSELKDDAYDRYDYTDYLITKVDRSADGASDLCRKEYDKGCEAFAELVIDAEVKAYEPKHSEILNKKKEDLTSADKEALIAAIKDLANLSDGSQAVFEGKNTPNDLAEKYKYLAKQEINSLLGDTSDNRKNYAEQFCSDIDALDFSGKADDLEALMAYLDTTVNRAEEIDRVFDRYEEILAASDYEGFTEDDKTAIDTAADSAALELAEADVSDGQLITLANEAITKLDQREAIARIMAAAKSKEEQTDSTKKAVADIVDAAKKEIIELTDPEEIKKTADEAIFDIKQEFDIQDMTAQAQDAIEDIKNMDALSEEQKKAYEEKISSDLAESTEAIRAISEESAHKDAVNNFGKQTEKTLEAAANANSEARADKKEEAEEHLKETHAQLIEDISGMNYLKAEEKEAYKNAADKALEQGLTALSEAETLSEITDAKNNGWIGINTIREQSEKQNLASGETHRTESDAEVRSAAQLLLTKINDAPYLTNQEKTSLAQSVNQALEEALEALRAASGVDELLAEKANAISKLNTLSADCDAKNLVGAKRSAINELNSQKNGIAEDVDGFWFLEAEKRDLLKQNADNIANEGANAINSCETVDAVLEAKKAAADELDKHGNLAKEAENQACVKALTPFMLTLAIICAVEGIILAVLWLFYKKATDKLARAASVIPLPVAAAVALSMPTPVAWTLLVILGLAVIALTVLIIYTAVKLCQALALLRPEPEEEPEEEETDGLEEDGGAVVPAKTEKPQARPRLKARPALARLMAAPFRPRLEPKPQLVYLMPPAMPEIVGLITARQADMMISDEDAYTCEETNIVNTEVYTGKKKAAINIDIIGKSFAAEELVSLNTLKEKGLIAKNVGHVKILGKGSLDKPLTVVAQDFSASAIKMIVLTGGKAILAEGSPDRRKRK